MATQRIIWTALPHGVEGDTLKISILVSPRLEPGAPTTLQHFPDFWDTGKGHWPGKMDGLSFTVEFDGGAPVKADRVKAGPDGAKYGDQNLWEGIFKASTPVEPFHFSDYKNRTIRSYPVRGVLGLMKNVYGKVAASSPLEHPSHEEDRDLADLRNAIGFINLRDGWDQFAAARLSRTNIPDLEEPLKKDKVLDASKFSTYGFPSLEVYSFVQATRFFERPEFQTSYLEKPNLALVPPRIKTPVVDFHQILASISDYPELMRRLGVVIELRIPKPAFSFNKIRIAIKPGGQGYDDAKAIRPWTWCTKDGSFRPLPRPGGTGDIDSGMLRLSGVDDSYNPQKNPKYDLVQIDPDGGSIKLTDFAANLYRMLAPNRKNYKLPEGAALPSLRSGGIGLVKFNRAYYLANLLKDASTKNAAAMAAGPVELYAEDLLRGYRVDVHDEKGWRSLCRRDGVYKMTAKGEQKIEIKDEEGYVKGASTTSKDGGASDLYFHEMMFNWTGWSICAKRPGQTIAPVTYNPDGTPKAAQEEIVTGNPSNGDLPQGVNLNTEFKATMKSLPRLRFGRNYRLRARVVDLAGNSEPHTTNDDKQATEPILYTRFEPVNPPALVYRAPIATGEWIENMVIRSNYNVAAKAYNDDLKTKLGGGYSEINERHIVPPKTSQLMAETHGMFDKDIDSGGAGVARAYNISKREIGTFFDRKIISAENGKPTDLPDPMSVQLISPPAVKAQPKYPIIKGDPEGFGEKWELNPIDPNAPAPAAGQYVIHKEERLLLPYLPDPIARGATFRGLPNSGSTEIEKVVKIPFTGSWPDYDTFLLRILEDTDVEDHCDGKEHNGLTHWDADKRVLSVFLAKGQMVRLRYSCYINPDDAKKMGIIRWLDQMGGASSAMKYITAGLHWMVTPYRELTLIHAVQQPVCEPTITKLGGVKKNVGATLAYLSGQFRIHTRSTGKIELLAEWDEPVDYITEPMPRDNPSNTDYKPVHGRAHVFEAKIEEFYPDNLPVPIAVKDPSKADAVVAVDPETFRHEFGDTKHRMVDYHLLGTTRFREYFPQEIVGDKKQISRDGPTFKVNIPSSARPDAPKILYVIPTFGWDPPQQIGDDIVSRRCGGGLRVYMDRPWYSSGESELLGVVLNEGAGSSTPTEVKGGMFKMWNTNEPGDTLKPYVTQWGMDPIWGSDPLKSGPSRSDFSIAVDVEGTVTGLSLDELRDGSGNPYPVVSVAPHEVEYDAERKLWFSDIVVDSGNSYFPFIRLALARYQPYSINNCHLSRVVLADFAQLAPDRVAAVTFDSQQKLRVMVSGVHGINTFTKGEGFNPADKKTFKNLIYSRRMTVTVETPLVGEADREIIADAGWVPVSKELTDMPLVPFQQYESKMVWMIEVNLPDKPKRFGGKSFRLVVKEYERLDADQEVGTVSLKNEREGKLLEEGKTDKDGMGVFLNDAIERLVYADTIEL